MPQSRMSRIHSSIAQVVDDHLGWPRVRPAILGVYILTGLRARLRAKNLVDSGRGALDRPPDVDPPQGYEAARTLYGTYNDLEHPLMGSLHSRFGRNLPRADVGLESGQHMLQPNPLEVSRQLMTRHEFQAADKLNLLAAAWIQFEVHDWFNHGLNDPHDPFVLEPDNPRGTILRTAPDPSPDPGPPPTFISYDTHWWDASQLYGCEPGFAGQIRSGVHGKLRVDEHGLIPAEVQAEQDLHGTAGNAWVGLAMMHGLFMLEHNAVCDAIRESCPKLDDEQLYQKARLVIAALLAKIHTTEWTPAMIARKTTIKGIRGTWWGLVGEGFNKRFGVRTRFPTITGVPGSRKALFGVDYALTEEFVAVYRMHPLVPDDYDFRAFEDNRCLFRGTLPDLDALHFRPLMQGVELADLFYSFGTSHPGALTLNNYPAYLQNLVRPTGELLDLAAVDILHTRERGVPRYNQFRRLLRLKPYSSFEALVGKGNDELAKKLRGVYPDGIESVDLMVGMYAEKKPVGFAFSDTAFRIFLVMAERRIEADRLFTDDFNEDVYTEVGYKWVETECMRTVLLRHFKHLAPALDGVKNPFLPWTTTKHSG